MQPHDAPDGRSFCQPLKMNRRPPMETIHGINGNSDEEYYYWDHRNLDALVLQWMSLISSRRRPLWFDLVAGVLVGWQTP
jgi:hypothetical protein